MGHLPPKKRARPAETFLEKTVKKAPSTKKPKIVRVVSSESDSSDSESESEIDDDEEEVIEEITTEGARANGLVASNRGQNSVAASNPLALKTEMNKVDVIVDGRPVAGMYQVVHHRIETISTTNAVVPRSVIEEQQVRQIFEIC